MPSSFARSYKESLPKKTISFWETFAKIAVVVSIFFPILQLVMLDHQINTTILICYNLFILTIVFIYLYYQESKKLNRYSEATLFVHYVNHVVRDILQQTKAGERVFAKETLSTYFLDQIAECFSIVTGKKCRACFKELSADLSFKTVARDVMGEKTLKGVDTTAVHRLEKNTDFKSVWYLEHGHSRYFLCNDLKKLYLDKYENSTFDYLGQLPTVNSFGPITYVKNWKLPYKSTLVVPIRYVSERANPEEKEQLGQHQHYWGFLCIDCKSTGVFNEIYAPELGAAFADALYILFSQLDQMASSTSR